MQREAAYLVALDAGGTMTDTFLVDEGGRFSLGKALTNREDESISYVESVADACSHIGVSRQQVHKQAIACIYTGTTMLNILLTRSGQKVGLLINKGMKHLPYMERALTWLHLSYADTMHEALQEHTQPLVDMGLIREVTGLVNSPTYYVGCHVPPGTVLAPLDEEDVSKGVKELLEQGAQTIGILFLHSYINPEHEKRAAEIARDVVRERGLDVPVITSYEVCPVSMESQRLKSLLLQCYAAEAAAKHLSKIERAAKDEGYKYDLLTLLSYGAATDIRHPRMYESIISGPAGGLLGGKALLSDIVGLENLICTDLGGTTFDVGLVAKGLLPVEPEPVFYGHKLNLPMLMLDSIGAGTGEVIHVDERLKTISLGPESAGALVGTCYEYPDITIGDLDLILGYLNPDYFLGGTVKLDKGAALKAVEERLAKPLGQDLYEISSKVLDLLHAGMREHIMAMLLSKGLNPAEFTLAVYGGSGPLHLWGIEDGMALAGVVTCPWAAAFSAYGVATADYFHRYQKSVTCVFAPVMPGDIKVWVAQSMNDAWQELEERGYAELQGEGYSREKVNFRYGVYARYLGQMASWEAPVEIPRVKTPEDIDKIIASFEKAYTSIYPLAARLPEAGYVVTSVVCEARVERLKPVVARYPLKDKKPPRQAYKGQREVYHRKWIKFDLWEMDLLEPGNRVDGPAIIEHPMTTLVIPPQNYVEIDAHKVIWYRRK